MKVFFTTLFAVLVALKLAGLLGWPWLWVLAPAWGPILLLLVLNLFAGALIDRPRR